jgi:hypothetical protein
MKKGGKAEGGESKKTHMAEMSKMKGLEKELKSHESKPASKGHKGLKTGGVANGQGGYKKGGDVKMAKGGVAGNGIINTEKQGGAYRDTMMHTAKPDHSPAKTGDVKNGNGGGYKTGGVTKSNAGGYKMGGKTSKKAYAAGGTVNSGRPVAMPEGRKPVPSSVRINQLAGTYKNGGKATPAEALLLKNNAAENASAMRDAKMDSNLKYGSPKRMADGGETTDMSNGAYDRHYANEKAENESMRNMILDPIKNVGKHIMRSFDPEGYFKGDERKKLFETQSRMGLADRIKENRAKGKGSVTETEKSITVTPAGKKRGGRAC